MEFTAVELAEIRSAFRQRIRTEPARKPPPRQKPKPDPLPALVREPDYDDAEILRPAQVAELFDVTPRTIRRWADAGMLPVLRTVGGSGASGEERFDTRATERRQDGIACSLRSGGRVGETRRAVTAASLTLMATLLPGVAEASKPKPPWSKGAPITEANVKYALKHAPKRLDCSLALSKPVTVAVDDAAGTVDLTYKQPDGAKCIATTAEVDALSIGAQTSYGAHRTMFQNPRVSRQL